MPGLLALVGGDEFHPGNEQQDRLMVAAAGDKPDDPANVITVVAPQLEPDYNPPRLMPHVT